MTVAAEKASAAEANRTSDAMADCTGRGLAADETAATAAQPPARDGSISVLYADRRGDELGAVMPALASFG